jgi:hypothetical protein
VLAPPLVQGVFASFCICLPSLFIMVVLFQENFVAGLVRCSTTSNADATAGGEGGDAAQQELAARAEAEDLVSNNRSGREQQDLKERRQQKRDRRDDLRQRRRSMEPAPTESKNGNGANGASGGRRSDRPNASVDGAEPPRAKLGRKYSELL